MALLNLIEFALTVTAFIYIVWVIPQRIKNLKK